MAILSAAAMNKAIESTEKIAAKDILQNAITEAESLTEGLWPETDKQEFSRSMSPSDIAKEAWEMADVEYGVGTLASPRYIIMLNEKLENSQHPISGVWFEKRVIELPDGEFIEGVFPRFDSLFDAKIPERLYLQPDRVQFRECNRQLLKEIENNPRLKEMFSEEQLEQIQDGVYDGTAPDGFVWHHDAEAGKLQLVDFETHSHTGHTGGRSLWGGGSDNR